MPREEILAFCYLQQVKDERNKCLLTQKHLVVIYRKKTTHFELEHLHEISFNERRWLLPLIAGGIVASFSLLAIFLNLYNPWPLFFLFVLAALGFYWGWMPHPVLTIRDQVKEHDFPLRYISANLKAFVSFVNQYKKQRNEMIYHVARTEEWEKAQQQDRYQAASLQKVGFIHGTSHNQLMRLKQYGIFPPHQSWTLLAIDPFKVKAEIRYETGDNPPGFKSQADELFPHIYGPINLDAVVRAEPLFNSAS